MIARLMGMIESALPTFFKYVEITSTRPLSNLSKGSFDLSLGWTSEALDKNALSPNDMGAVNTNTN